MQSTPSSALRWFRRVLGVGIVANLALAVPALFAPAAIMTLTRLPPATPMLWPRFSAMLIILLSVFYSPAVFDPVRYRAVAWLAVASRLAGVVFFLGFQSVEYHWLGYFDLVFLIPEGVLLVLSGRTAVSPGSAYA